MEVIYRTLSHLGISLVGVLIAVIVGVLLGIILTRVRFLAKPVMAIIDVIQTVPSIAMLSILLMWFGLGNITAVITIFLYSLLPIVRNTYIAIIGVDKAIIEVGRGMGMSGFQLLYKVEIPNAFPLILSGIRVSMITAYGIVTIAVLVGGGGLGYYIYRGTQTTDMKMILTGAIPICFLAMGTDIFMNKLENKLIKGK